MQARGFSRASATWLWTAPAVGLAHFVARNQSAATPAAAQTAAVVQDGARRGRSHDAAIFYDAGYRAAHQAM